MKATCVGRKVHINTLRTYCLVYIATPRQYIIRRVGLKIEIHEIHEIHQNLRNPVSINRPIVSVTCLNQSPTSSDWRTWTVDEIEVASSLNLSILVECVQSNAWIS